MELTIPPELVGPIILHFNRDVTKLGRRERAKAFYPLLLVSRSFNYETLRVLHRNVYLKLDVIPSTIARLQAFADTPHICEHVRSLTVTMENLTYYDLRHDELRTAIFTGLPALRNLEYLSVNHFRAPFIIPCHELLDPSLITFKLKSLTVYAGAHSDEGIWSFLETQPSITHLTYLYSTLRPVPEPPKDIVLLPNLQTAHGSAEMIKYIISTKPPRRTLSCIQLEAGSKLVNLGPIVPTVSYLILSIRSPANMLPFYIRFFPKLELLRVFASGWEVSASSARSIADQLKALPHLRKIYFIDSAVFPNSDLRTVVECVMDELADTLQEGYFDKQTKVLRFVRTGRGKELELQENLGKTLLENVWERMRDPVRRDIF